MTAAPKQSFDGAAAIFNEHAKTLRGYVRYNVIERNLEPYLTKAPMRVLDVGGGSGIDAAWLAVKGHQVTLLEASKVQCDAAEARFNYFLTDAERSRITLAHGTFADLPATATKFDLVLLHGVAMYQAAPAEFIATAATFCAPKGIFSLVEPGYYGAQARVIRRGEEAQLKNVQSSRVFYTSLKMDVQVFKPEELEAYLTAGAIKTETWSGVRVITDEMFENVADIDGHVLQDIVDVEYEQGRHPGIRAQGQLLHFIGRKR